MVGIIVVGHFREVCTRRIEPTTQARHGGYGGLGTSRALAPMEQKFLRAFFKKRCFLLLFLVAGGGVHGAHSCRGEFGGRYEDPMGGLGGEGG